MKNIKFIYGLFITAMLLNLFIVSFAMTPEIKYAESVRPISLEGKVLQSFYANYKKDLTKESVLEMARLLTEVSGKSLNFEKLMDMKNGLMLLRNEEDPSALFEMDTRSGSFLYNGGLKEYKEDGSTPNLIMGKEAESIALQHLDKLGLMPNKRELRLVNIGGLNMAALREDGSTEVYNKLVTVRYNRILSGLNVMGASRIIVHMGTNGKLAGLIFNWGEVVDIKKIEPAELLTDKEIKEILESRLMEAAKDAEKIIVQKVDLVLYDDGRGQIEPAYHVQANLFYEASYDIPYDYYIPILKKPLAFYPYMETYDIKPTDARDFQISPKDNE